MLTFLDRYAIIAGHSLQALLVEMNSLYYIGGASYFEWEFYKGTELLNDT